MHEDIFHTISGSVGSFFGFTILQITFWNSFEDVCIKCFASLLFGIASVLISNLIIPWFKRKFKINE